MTVIKSKDFTIQRRTTIKLGEGVNRILALAAQPGCVVHRDDTRNKAFPDCVGYKVVHADPLRDQLEGALYYVDFHPSEGYLIFIQGKEPINMRVVYSVTEQA